MIFTGETIMIWTKTCSVCGGSVRSDEPVCPQCGAPNEVPQTIEELKSYCRKRGMPLQRMRFFIGENYQEPKAFGIYEQNGRYIVYKNKANGTRAVRYDGPDEGNAVKELFLKLLDECHNRGIYPDGEPKQMVQPQQKHKRFRSRYTSSNIILYLFILFVALFLLIGYLDYRRNGYYRSGDDTLYYRYNSVWYVSDDDTDWHKTDYPGETIEEYYSGRNYDPDWGQSNFTESRIWEDLQESSSSSSSSDYDSWDSSDTNWDSDW